MRRWISDWRSVVLPKNAENFLNTEAEYLRYCHEWENGMSLDL